MKTIGLIGGMSWESSAVYYRLINQEVQKRLGGAHSAKIVMVSFDFAELEELQRAGRWDDAAKLMVDKGAHAGARGRRDASHLHQHHASYGGRGRARRWRPAAAYL